LVGSRACPNFLEKNSYCFRSCNPKCSALGECGDRSVLLDFAVSSVNCDEAINGFCTIIGVRTWGTGFFIVRRFHSVCRMNAECRGHVRLIILGNWITFFVGSLRQKFSDSFHVGPY
jgi:hypothetical protein